MKKLDDSYYVYIVDDNQNVLEFLKKLIRAEYHVNIRTFSNAEDCLKMIDKREPDFIISDLNLNPLGEKNRMNGNDLLKSIKEKYPYIRVIIYSSSNELNTIIDLLKSGAFDFVGMGSMFEKRFTVAFGNALKKVHEDREFLLTRRGIINLIVLMLAVNVVLFFIDVNFMIYLIVCLLPPLFFILLLGYYKYYFRKGSRKLKVARFPLTGGKKEFKIFVVDDSEVYRLMITNALDKERTYFYPDRYSIKTFASAEKCLKELSAQPDILILDYLLEDSDDQARKMNGLKMLEEVKKISPDTKVIMISSQKDTAVISELLKEGAQDYILKDKLWQNKIRNSTHRLLKLKKNKNRNPMRWWQKLRLKPVT